MFQAIEKFAEREVKFAEAALLSDVANTLTAKAPDLEPLVDADAPAGVAAIVAAVEKADAALGPAVSAAINGTLSAYSAQVESALATLADGAATVASGKVVQVATAVKAVAAKLQAEALAA